MRAHREGSDVDRGWAFVVLLSSCLGQLLTFGFSYTSSIFYAVFLDEFQQSPVFTAWTVNINNAVLFIAGELSTVVVACVGTRNTIVVGCILSTIGLLSCYFARHLVTIFVLYGLLGGFGFACAYFPIFDVIFRYFRRHRTAAFAISSCGVGLGQFIYPALFHKLDELYSWRGAFLILAGINLHLLVIAAVFMQPRDGEMANQSRMLNFGYFLKSQFHQQIHNLMLLRQPRWSFWCVSSVMSCIGVSGFYTHIYNYARVLDISSASAMFLLSVIGVSNLVGRLSMGFLTRMLHINVIGLYILLFSILGVANLMNSFATSYSILVLSSVLCGISVSAFGLIPEACVHILGASNLTTGVSYSCLFGAIGIISGGPMAAALYEIDPFYHLSFLTVGIISLVGAFLNIRSFCFVKKGRFHLVPSAEMIETERKDMTIEEEKL